MKPVLIFLLLAASSFSYASEECNKLRETLSTINPAVTVAQYGHPLEGLMIPYYSKDGIANDTAHLESMCEAKASLAFSNSQLNPDSSTRKAKVCGVDVFKCHIVSRISQNRRRHDKGTTLSQPDNNDFIVLEHTDDFIRIVSKNPPFESGEDYEKIVSDNPVRGAIIDGVEVDLTVK